MWRGLDSARLCEGRGHRFKSCHSHKLLPVTLPTVAGQYSPHQIGFLQHRVGDRIKDRYDVLERLGGGNFGSVYRVLDTAVGNVLACKEMHVLDNPHTPVDERAGALDLFKREALNLATLRHPNIPSAYFDQEEGNWRVCPICGQTFENAENCPDHGAPLLKVNTRFYLMMDFVDGPTMEDLAAQELQQKGVPLPEARCLEWIHQIGTALRTLHRVGIIHRDIKPENIKIRTEEDIAVLLDFGLTKRVEDAGGYGTAPLTGTARFGTAGYAPENPQERERPEKRSDIHALGMTLYRLLSGRDPQDERQLREMREFSPRYFNREISPEVEHLILVAIAPELNLRYQSIDDFLADLQSIRRPNDASAPLPPFTFANGQKARNATDLARLLPNHEEESLNYLFNGMFASWLVQNGFAAPAQVASQVTKAHAQNPPVALELFRRALYPTGTSHVLPKLEIEPAILNFGSLPSGAKTGTTLRLRNGGPGLLWGEVSVPPRNRPGQTAVAVAVNSLLNGGAGEEESTLPGLKFPTEFQGNLEDLELELDTNRVPVGAYASHLAINTDAGITRVPVSYSVVPLELQVEPDALDFGSIQIGKKMMMALSVAPTDARGGTPRGTVYVGPSLIGASAPDRFEGAEAFAVFVDASSPAVVARLYEGLLQLDTNGGRLRVPVRYRITLPFATLAGLIGQSVAWGAVGGAALRLAYYLVNPDFASKWLLRPTLSGQALADFQNRGLGPLLAGATLGTYGAWLYSRRLAKINSRERPGFFKNTDDTFLQSMPMLGLFFGAFGGYLGAQLLHWTLWSLGDWLLFPFARMLPGQLGVWAQNHAPIVWAGAGAFGGLMWGLTRLLSATGRGSGRTVFAVFLASAFLILLLNATLSGGS